VRVRLHRRRQRASPHHLRTLQGRKLQQRVSLLSTRGQPSSPSSLSSSSSSSSQPQAQWRNERAKRGRPPFFIFRFPFPSPLPFSLSYPPAYSSSVLISLPSYYLSCPSPSLFSVFPQPSLPRTCLQILSANPSSINDYTLGCIDVFKSELV